MKSWIFLMFLFILNTDKATGQSAKPRWNWERNYFADYTYNQQGECTTRKVQVESFWEEDAIKSNKKSQTKLYQQKRTIVAVSPLPNIKEQITIDVNGLAENNSLSYIMTSISGMTIFSGFIGNGKSVLTTSNLPKGIYILKISGNLFEEEYKLIKE